MECAAMKLETEDSVSLGLCACCPTPREAFITSLRIEIKGYTADCPASEDGHNVR